MAGGGPAEEKAVGSCTPARQLEEGWAVGVWGLLLESGSHWGRRGVESEQGAVTSG